MQAFRVLITFLQRLRTLEKSAFGQRLEFETGRLR